VIRLDPSFSAAFLNRGKAYFNMKDYARAIADYNAAIQLDPVSGASSGRGKLSCET
jgi:tetratricopeptide (TPR) repeat protein